MPAGLLSSGASPAAGDAQFLPVRRHQPGSGPSSSGSNSSFAVSLQCAMSGFQVRMQQCGTLACSSWCHFRLSYICM